MAIKEKATTSAEFKKKYGRRRLSPATAGKAFLYNVLYKVYQYTEKAPEIMPLYSSLESFQNMITTVDEAEAYRVYADLTTWINIAFESAINMRDRLTALIGHFDNIATTALAAEEVRRNIGEKAEEVSTGIWLKTLTIDEYTPQSDSGFLPGVLRRNINTALRYLLCYNTCIHMIADKIETPELDLYCINMESTEVRLRRLNEVFTALRENVALYRIEETSPEITAGEVLSNLYQYTPEYLRETLKSFDPVPLNPEPIPEENIKKAEAILTYDIMISHKRSWHSVMTALKKGYVRGETVNNGL